MLLASSNIVSLEFSGWCMALSSPLMSLLGPYLRWGCSCHLWAFPLAHGMCIIWGWSLVWSLLWVPCVALCVTSMETQTWKKEKPCPSPGCIPRHSPRAWGTAGSDVMEWTTWVMGLGLELIQGSGVTMSHGPSRNLHFESCPDLDVPTVPLAVLELFCISHMSLELCWLGACGSYMWMWALKAFLCLSCMVTGTQEWK